MRISIPFLLLSFLSFPVAYGAKIPVYVFSGEETALAQYADHKDGKISADLLVVHGGTTAPLYQQKEVELHGDDLVLKLEAVKTNTKFILTTYIDNSPQDHFFITALPPRKTSLQEVEDLLSYFKKQGVPLLLFGQDEQLGQLLSEIKVTLPHCAGLEDAPPGFEGILIGADKRNIPLDNTRIKGALIRITQDPFKGSQTSVTSTDSTYQVTLNATAEGLTDAEYLSFLKHHLHTIYQTFK